MGFFSKAFKKVTKPFKKVAKAVTKVASKAFSIVKDVGSSIAKGLRKVGDVFQPKTPKIPEVKPPAPPAPEPEQYAEGMSTPENISRRKRNRRNGLRIDLNTGGGASGQGVNVPVG